MKFVPNIVAPALVDGVVVVVNNIAVEEQQLKVEKNIGKYKKILPGHRKEEQSKEITKAGCDYAKKWITMRRKRSKSTVSSGPKAQVRNGYEVLQDRDDEDLVTNSIHSDHGEFKLDGVKC
uniref:Uncharacterized protein n=1 Tax=Cannabis sativa TaxID=3483 RepID=A0A803QQT4_CANSA